VAGLLYRPIGFLHSILSVLVIAIATIILFPFLILVILIDIKYAFYIQWLWAKVFLFICGVRLHIHYDEPIPNSGSILLFNHSSFLDIPILVMVSGRFMYYVAKKELEKIPVLGTCFKLVKTLMMPRNDLKASIELYDEAKKRLASGDQFVIAPEGTRNRGEGIADFKSGPFIFALSCKADLIPVIIRGANKLWPPQDLLPNWRKMTSSIHVHVGQKISTQDWTEDNRKAKMLELKNKFEETYYKLP
jgi:1-acyl-sn-glycerol-3-phosphate acyltransferase